MDSALPNQRLRNRLILSVVALLILVGVAGYFLVKKAQNDIIEQQALTVAEIVARHAGAARSIYSDNIVQKLISDRIGFADVDFHEKVGAVPIPAQYVRSVAEKASTDSAGLYEYHAVSKWNLRADQGLSNDFLKSGWAKLEAQDKPDPGKPIDWKPIHAIVKSEGEGIALLYLKADPATSESCVNCHNSFESSERIIEQRIQQGVSPGKRWKQHQLMGAFFVKIPLSGIKSLAVKKSSESILWIVSVLTAGLALMAFFLIGDVLKANEKTHKLIWQARHDRLTGLPNWTHFEEKAEALIADAKSTVRTHFLFYLDLDRFKIINDSCGHAAGDELLIQIAAEIGLHLEPGDVLARLGGDEFGILLKDCNANKARSTAKALCKQVKNYHYVCEEKVFDIGVSIGMVEITARTESTEKLISQADIACYAAKGAGRNGAQLYKENNEEVALQSNHMSWVSRIIIALEQKHLLIFAQEISPISNAENDQHFEILVRLREKGGQTVPPDEFLPAAERYDLMRKIDTYVIEQALSALEQGKFGHNVSLISINLSGQSLSQKSFLESTTNLINRHSVDPKQICFEITETSAIKNPALVRRFMDTLKDMGVQFSLDDFGTGLSSLTYLKQFPVDYLKIDGSFVKDMVSNPVDRKLVEAIASMAHTLNIKTIAEYVETQEILSALEEIGVDYAQGFFIGKPQPLSEIKSQSPHREARLLALSE